MIRQLNTKNPRIGNAKRQLSQKFTLMELVIIFKEEALKICDNEVIANSIALESLHDYIRRYASNTKVVF